MTAPSTAKQQVFSLMQSNRITEARDTCTRLCRDTPDDPEVWFMLAGIHAATGNLEQVIACCQKVIALQPGNVMARYNLGVALQTLGRHAESMDHYREVLRRHPGLAAAQANLAGALWKENRLEEALGHASEAVRLDPAQASAQNTLGLVLKGLERMEEAAAAFREANRLAPGLAEAHYNLGLCLLRNNRLEEAETCLLQAIRIKSDYAEAYKDLGQLYRRTNQPDQAVANFERYARLRPDEAEAHILHGNALQMRDNGRDDQLAAESCLRKALGIEPESLTALFHLAQCREQLGALDEARAILEQVLRKKPDHDDARAWLAKVHEHQGDFAAAEEAMRPLLDKGSNNEHVALAYAALSRHSGKREDAIALLGRTLEADGDLPLRSRMEIHFMLGKLHDELKDYESAFHHYQQANDLDPSPFHPVENGHVFDAIINGFGPEKQKHRPRASNRSRLPVFIVGMPRSGTSLVEQILSSHPLVHGAGELQDMHRIAASLSDTLGTQLPYPANLDALTRKNIDPIAQRHLDQLGKLADGKARVTDKMPHNFTLLGLIELLFPEARVIHCTRDPIDTCLSIYFLHFNRHHAYAHNLEHLGLYYRQYQRMMTHWQNHLRLPMLEVNYETLVDNPESTIRGLVKFIGLDWDDRCLRFHESKRAVTTPSYDQVRRPLYKKSVARWKHYEQYLGPLMSALQGADVQDCLRAAGT